MKYFISILTLATISLWAAESPARKPNIIVLLSDDAGYNSFSCHGNEKFSTPHIDSIAKNGIRYTQGYVSGCVCSPTRAGFLAGRYQQKFGHEFNIPPAYSETNGLPLSETLLPQVLKDNGYRTIAIGKWHLGYAHKFHPMERGFTDYYGFLQGSRSYFPQASPNRLSRLLDDQQPVEKEDFTYMTDHLADKACEAITEHKNQPFFLYLAFNATHGPVHTTKEDLEKAGGDKIYAMTIALDRAVGKVLSTLDTHELTKHTLIFFLNDNGGAGGRDNTPLRGHKGSTWEGGIRVPFLIQWPGTIPAGSVNHTPVIALDIFPTALAAAAIKYSPEKALDGINLLPIIQTPATDRTLYWKNGSSWAIRHGDLKLVAGNKDHNAPAPELYNLSSDISEAKNLATAQPEDVQRLRKLYDQWQATHIPTPWASNKVDNPKKKKK